MANTIADKLLELGFQASYDPYNQPNKPYHIRLGSSTEPINRNNENILFGVEGHDEKLINARVKHGNNIAVPLSNINTIEKVEHFLAAVKAE